jgi:hypothetical protein
MTPTKFHMLHFTLYCCTFKQSRSRLLIAVRWGWFPWSLAQDKTKKHPETEYSWRSGREYRDRVYNELFTVFSSLLDSIVFYGIKEDLYFAD